VVRGCCVQYTNPTATAGAPTTGTHPTAVPSPNGTLTMASRTIFGRAPRDTTHCPRCDIRTSKEGRLVSPRPDILERYGAWCQALNCRKCGNEWYICTNCSSTRVAIDSMRQLVRHASCFHSTSKRANKRMAGAVPEDGEQSKRRTVMRSQVKRVVVTMGRRKRRRMDRY
jgi:hypothetical protein